MPAGWEIMKGEMGGEDLVPRLPDAALPEREQLAGLPVPQAEATIPRQRSHPMLHAIGQHLLKGATQLGKQFNS